MWPPSSQPRRRLESWKTKHIQTNKQTKNPEVFGERGQNSVVCLTVFVLFFLAALVLVHSDDDQMMISEILYIYIYKQWRSTIVTVTPIAPPSARQTCIRGLSAFKKTSVSFKT